MNAAAFVRWYDAADTRNNPHPLRSMQRLKWATLRERRTELAHYDVILADRIIRMVYIQPDPTSPQHFYFDHYVR